MFFLKYAYLCVKLYYSTFLLSNRRLIPTFKPSQVVVQQLESFEYYILLLDPHLTNGSMESFASSSLGLVVSQAEDESTSSAWLTDWCAYRAGISPPLDAQNTVKWPPVYLTLAPSHAWWGRGVVRRVCVSRYVCLRALPTPVTTAFSWYNSQYIVMQNRMNSLGGRNVLLMYCWRLTTTGMTRVITSFVMPRHRVKHQSIKFSARSVA